MKNNIKLIDKNINSWIKYRDSGKKWDSGKKEIVKNSGNSEKIYVVEKKWKNIDSGKKGGKKDILEKIDSGKNIESERK